MNPEISPSAPVVIFAYNRPRHLKRVLAALKDCEGFSGTRIYAFVDGPKNQTDRKKISVVTEILREFTEGQNSEVVVRSENVGLRRNIVSGLDWVFSRETAAIVLEDDIVPRRQFLNYMNSALTKYADYPRVWHIGGYAEPHKIPDLPDVYFSRQMHCWGWATWANRWKQFSREPQRLVEKFSQEDIFNFDFQGTKPNWSQVTANYDNRIDTWAIFWMATIFENNGLCLNPAKSLVSNIGMDGSGTHFTTRKIKLPARTPSEASLPREFPSEIFEHEYARDALAKFYQKKLWKANLTKALKWLN